ncbi:MAG: hypothetical protein ABSG95_11505 [Solirubrobacteraceae bacterium]
MAAPVLFVVLALSMAAPAGAASFGVMAWGYNESGQLGKPTRGPSPYSDVPVAVRGLSNVTAVTTGWVTGQALLNNGTVMEWGNEAVGESAVPVAVSGLSGATAISANAYENLALLSNGTVVEWESAREVPVPVSGLSNVTAISANGGGGLALLTNGTVMAWGANGLGQLGDGTTTNSEEPVEVSGLAGVKAVSASGGQSLALLEDGRVMAWGDNEVGQLGDGASEGPETCGGSFNFCSTRPVEVSGLSNVTAISASGDVGLALLGNDMVMAWGNNGVGQLGDGTSTGPETCRGTSGCSRVPLVVDGLSEVTAVSAGLAPQGGGSHNLALLRDGAVMAWGAAPLGALGNGSPSGPEKCAFENYPCSTTPVAVIELGHVTAIAAGVDFSLAMNPAPSPPELGRCVEVGAGMGDYAGGCSVPRGRGHYEWRPEALKTGFTSTGGAATLETVGKWKMACKTEAGRGEYAGTMGLRDFVLTFSGCEALGHECSTAGAVEGEVVTNALEGLLQWRNKAMKEVALDLLPAGGTGWAQLECGGRPIEVNGSLLVPATVGKASAATVLKYSAAKGKQKPREYVTAAGMKVRDFLEANPFAEGFEQAGLTAEVTLRSEEPLEIDAFV